MVDLWVPVTFGYSFIAAAYMMANDVFKLPGDLAVFWRSLFACLFMLPLCLIIEWPTDTEFYIFIGIGGFICAVSDIIMFQALKDHGGAAIARMTGLRPALLFFLWPVFYNGAMDELTKSPLISLGILTCLAVIAATIFLSRKNHIGRAAFFAFLPCLVLFTLGDIAWKFATPTAASFDRVTAIAFISMLMMVFVTGTYKLIHHKRILMHENLIPAASINAVLVIAVVMVKSLSLSLAPNPSYVNALSLIFVLWTYLAHKYLFKKEDNASPVAGFVVVVAAAILTVLVEMLPK